MNWHDLIADLPSLSFLNARFAAAAVVAMIAGLVRGFSGFGSGLVYVPLIAAIYNPLMATITILIIDVCCSAPISVKALTRCDWREVAPMAIATAIALPFGILVLVMADPLVLRWCIAVGIFAFIVPIASGWRYRGELTRRATVVVGLVSGLMTGALQIGGPVVVIYWLGTIGDHRVLRANLLALFILVNIFALMVFFLKGLITVEMSLMALFLALPFLVAITVGAKLFDGASQKYYRSVASGLIALTAVISFPIFDGLLR